jgi:hypothetical protein
MDKEAIVTSPAGPSRQSPCRETSGLRAGSSVEALKNASDLAEPSTSGLPATANAGHGKKASIGQSITCAHASRTEDMYRPAGLTGRTRECK